MLLIYNNRSMIEAMSEQEQNEIFSQVDALMKELTESGELVGGEALADPSNTKTVRVRSCSASGTRRTARAGTDRRSTRARRS